MDESPKRAVCTADAKNISSSLDEDFGNDFLSSWKLPKSGKDTIDFTVPKSSKKFSFDNLDYFGLDGAFDILPSFQMGMSDLDFSDLDFSSPQKKKVKHSSSNADHSEEKKETDLDNFSFSFDFDELLGKFSLDGKLGIEEKSTSRFTGKSDPVSSEVKKDTQRGLSAKGNAILEEDNSTNKAHTLDTCTLRPSHLTNHESVKNVSQPTSNIDAADSSDKMQERTSVNPATMEQTKVDSVLNDNPGEQPKEIYPTKAPVNLPSQDFSCSAISSEDPTQGLADPVNSKDAPIVDSGKVHVSRESNDDEQSNGLRSRDTSIINPNVSRRPVGQFNSRNEVLEESVSLNEGSQDNQSFSGAPKKFLKKTSHGTKNTEEEISGPKSLSCSMQRRKSVHSFKVIEDADTQGPIEVPASQTATMTGSQFSQDVMHVVADKNEHCVPSSSGEAISDVLGKEDSLAEKDGCDDLTYSLTSIQELDESEEEEFIRNTLGFKEIRKERVSLRNSIPGVRSLRSNTEQKSSMRVHPPESPLPQPRQDQISELDKHLFPGGAANAKCTDDESEGSPDTVMGEPSLVHDSSDVPMTDENFTGSEIDWETPNLGARAADHILDPEPYLPDHAYERQPGGSSVGLCRNTEVTKENEACRRSNISVEEDDVTIDYPTIGRSTSETEASSHHLEGSSAEELVSKPGRHAAPDGIDRTLHAAENSIQHLEVVKEGGVLQDKSSQSLEMPLEDIDPVNQPQMHGGSTKKLAPDLCNALSLTKQKKQQAAQEGKMKKQSKRGKKVADKSSHALEIPQANLDSENQPHNDDVSIEQQTVLSSTVTKPR